MDYYGFTVGHAAEGESPAQTYDRLFDLTSLADRTGFDGWFFAEHHAPHFVPSPNLLLAVASQQTSRLRLGVTVTLLPYHHPLRVAEEIRMLDQLSEGRLEIAFGRGAVARDQLAYGVDRDTTSERLDTSLEVVLRLLTEGGAKYRSPWWKGEVEGLTPPPVQRPHPPMWISAVSSKSIVRAARLGAHVATLLLSNELASQYRREYREEWGKRRPAEPVGKFSMAVYMAVGDTREEAERYARDVIATRMAQLAKGVSRLQGAGPGTADPAYADRERGIRDFTSAADDFDLLVDRGFVIFGSVQDAVSQVRRLADSGIEVLTIQPQFGLDHGFERHSLELFATEVMPKADPAHQPLAQAL